jgi:hypothetical protein
LEHQLLLAWDDRNRELAKRFQRHCTDLLLTGLGAIAFFWIGHFFGLLVPNETSLLVRLCMMVHSTSKRAVEFIMFAPPTSWWGAQNISMNLLYIVGYFFLTFVFHAVLALGGIVVVLLGIAVLLLAMYLFRTAKLPDVHESPVLCLLGVAGCGGALLGRWMVKLMGGRPEWFVSLWLGWVSMHYMLYTCVDQIGPKYYANDSPRWYTTVAAKTLLALTLAIVLPYYLAVLSF